jgi:rubrerythrin
MFTDDNFLEYISQINEIEIKMESQYRVLAESLSHPRYRQLFARLVVEEMEHQDRIDLISEMFSKKAG